MTAIANQNALLDIREVAALLRLSSRTVWSLKASGDLPFVQIGRAVRFRRADVDQFVESRLAAR